jgi:hypothetical protein
VNDEIEASSEDQAPAKRPWPLMIGIIILTLLGIWLVPDNEEPATPDAPGTITRSAPPPIPETKIEGDYARAFIRDLAKNKLTIDDVYKEAQRMQQKGMLADAYLLYFYAARRGHIDSALALGSQADPAYYSSDSSVLDAPNTEQAHKWYLVASRAGDPEAGKRLDALRSQIEQQAASGDENAKRLMLQWK